MPYFHLLLSAPSSPVSHVPNNLMCQNFDYAVEIMYFPRNSAQLNHHISVNTSSSFTSHSFLSRPRAFLFTVDFGETSDIGGSRESKESDSSEKNILSSTVEALTYDDSPLSLGYVDDKEWQRRRKIGLANKGRVPWNKGRKHSVETRERIKQRTREALRDPKVRKKMTEHPRAQSDQIKSKISSSLRRVWGERLKWKRLSEKFFQSWAESIAVAAKKGGEEQEELDWDSYNKIREQMLIQQLQWATEKAKAKELAKIRAEFAAKTKAEKKAMLSHKRGVLDEDAIADVERLSRQRKENRKKEKERKEIKKEARKKSKEDVKEFTVAERLKLKQRLTKIRRKKSVNGIAAGQVNPLSSHTTAWEKLDLELKKKQKAWKEVSLADQIQFAKNQKAESNARALGVSGSTYHSSENSFE